MTVEIVFLHNPAEDIQYLEPLVALERNAIETNSAPYALQHDRAFFSNNLSGNAINIIAVANGELIGYSCYRPMQPWPNYLEPMPYPPEKCVMLVYTLLDAKWRGQGIGKRLNEARMTAIRRQGFRYLFATIHPENTLNMQLQQAMGFRVIAQKNMFSSQQLRNLLFMELPVLA